MNLTRLLTVTCENYIIQNTKYFSRTFVVSSDRQMQRIPTGGRCCGEQCQGTRQQSSDRIHPEQFVQLPQQMLCFVVLLYWQVQLRWQLRCSTIVRCLTLGPDSRSLVEVIWHMPRSMHWLLSRAVFMDIRFYTTIYSSSSSYAVAWLMLSILVVSSYRRPIILRKHL